MRPFDRRLLQYARSTRVFLCVSVALGTLTTALVITQAWLLAVVVSSAVAGNQGLKSLQGPLGALLVVIALRACCAWAADIAAARCAGRAKSELRMALLERAADGSTGAGPLGTGALVALATRGVDALDAYFARYLPQVILAVIAPAAILVVVVSRDWISALVIALTLPLIPLFMALIGAASRERSNQQLDALQRLAGHFLDVVAGLPTLKIFGRAKAQATTIREVTDRYRRSIMATLKVSFLSSLVLELLATISVALVAVAIGLRLMGGRLDLRTALFVLVLAPEAYLPLRQLGASHHASTDGIAAAAQVFDVLAQPATVPGSRRAAPDPSRSPITVRSLQVMHAGRDDPALDDVSLDIAPGSVTAVTGPSGCGKSTLLAVLLGLLRPSGGSVSVGEVDLAELDPDAWRARIAWVPQRPYLLAASLRDNVRLGRPDASDADVRAALGEAGLGDVIATLPLGLDTVLGERGAGLSGGERQRVALARAFLRDAPLLLLDEPTAGLDGKTEEGVTTAIRRLAQGRTVVIAAHRPALLSLAARVVQLAPAAVLQ